VSERFGRLVVVFAMVIAAFVVSSLLQGMFCSILSPPSQSNFTDGGSARTGALPAPAVTSSAPTDRWGAQMADDPAEDYTLLFSGSSGHINEKGTTFGDTWTYKAGVWTNLSPPICTITTCPEARTYGGLSYYNHSGQQYLVLFGGRLSATTYDDTWTWNGSWHNVTPKAVAQGTNAPYSSTYVSMAWDPADGYIVEYGNSYSTGNRDEQTWAFEGLNVTGIAVWSLIPTPVHPPGLYSEALTYDAADRYVLLFGGGAPGATVYMNQTWSYTAASGWMNRTAAIMTATNTPPVEGLIDGQMTYDPTTTSLILFSGQHFWASPTSGDKTANATLNATWSFSSGVWKNATVSPAPHPRFGAAMAFSPSVDAVVLFGGLSGTEVNATALGDTWWLIGDPGAWTNHTTALVTYSVMFTEADLPAGTEWWVNLTLDRSFSSTTATLSFNEPNGSYTYSVSATGYQRVGGSFAVRGGSPAPVAVRFTPIPSSSSGLSILDYAIFGVVTIVVAIGVMLILMRVKGNASPISVNSPSQLGEGAPPTPPKSGA